MATTIPAIGTRVRTRTSDPVYHGHTGTVTRHDRGYVHVTLDVQSGRKLAGHEVQFAAPELEILPLTQFRFLSVTLSEPVARELVEAGGYIARTNGRFLETTASREIVETIARRLSDAPFWCVTDDQA